MVEKIKDAARILNAKLKKDELEENLIQVTSEQNWQAPTNVLHDIANAAYNYEKWQQISQFIWQKLKKKNTWRKILKTLNLVEFLIKNGPPNIISSFKYDIYQFRSFNDYSHYSDSVDRGEAIRERAKSIVDLLSNEELLEEEREKAKAIRDRMSGVVGGSNYGSYSNSGSNTFGKSSNTGNKYGGSMGSNDYGGGILPGSTYGGYSETKSTLDKYKNQGGKKTNEPTKPIANILPSSMGGNSIVSQSQPTEAESKKPFQKEVKKLSKPGQRPQSIVPQPAKTESKQESVVSNGNNNGGGLLDDEIFSFSEPVQQKPQKTQQINFINPMYSTTAPMAEKNLVDNNVHVPQQQVQQHVQQQPQQVQQVQQPHVSQQMPPQQPQQMPAFQPQYNQQQQWNMNQGQYVNPMYGQTAPMVNQQQQQGFNPYINPMYGQTGPMAAQGYPQQPNYINPMYGQTGPMAATNVQGQQVAQPQISLSAKNAKNDDDDFGGFQSAQSSSHQNVKWLSENEKGLIDFSDLGSSGKNNNAPQSNSASGSTGNNIKIDSWNW